jgi:outer membrane protein assembly factor BamB
MKPHLILLSALLLGAAGAAAEDWPHWRGLHRDGISRETGLLKTWPAAGPKLLWQRPLPGGYSSVVVADGRLFTLTEDRKEESVLCLDPGTGKQLWEYRYPCDYDRHPSLDQRFKSGPRSTPAVDGDRVYTLGTAGMLHCLEAKSGKVVWQADLLKMAERACPEFGYTASPLVRGELLFVHPGGQNGASLAALDKRTGRVVWKSEDDAVGYATPIVVEEGEAPQLLFFTGAGLTAVAPDDGKLLWRFPWKTSYDLNVATPIHAGGKVFLSSNYGKGAALLRLKPGGAPEEVYRTAAMQNHFSTSVLKDGHLYGFNNDRLRCVALETAEVKWDQRGLGRGSLLIADGRLIAFGDNGILVMAEATPSGYTETARWSSPLKSPCWTSPALSDGRLFLRNEQALMAVDLVRP